MTIFKCDCMKRKIIIAERLCFISNYFQNLLFLESNTRKKQLDHVIYLFYCNYQKIGEKKYGKRLLSILGMRVTKVKQTFMNYS